MALVYSNERKSSSFREFLYSANLTFSGNYATGGEAAALRGKMPTTQQPYDVVITSKNGFRYEYDKANDKILVFGQEPTSATAGVIALSQLAAAAYPAGVTGDTIQLSCKFPKFG